MPRNPQDPDLRPVLPGSPVPGSRISVPSHVRRGDLLQGQVPIGSRVLVAGQPAQVDADGRFSYLIPVDAGEVLWVEVKRPAPDNRPAMRLRVQLIP